MVAKILVVNECRLNLSKVTADLQCSYNLLLFSKSIEDSLRIVGTQSIDVVFVALPQEKTKLFSDFFAVLRQLCNITPIIGVFNGASQIVHQYVDENFDDFIGVNVSKNAVKRKIHALVKLKRIFDDNLFGNLYFMEKRSQKIVTFFYNNLDFLHENIFKNTEIERINSWPIVDEMSDADLFLINVADARANGCCAELRLKRINKYKPIVLTYDLVTKNKAKASFEADIGCTDIINISADPVITCCKLNSLMRHKKMYESFSEKLKKSLYMSAIDSTTGVYNRSFFEDYINKYKHFFNSAVFLVDIDKFKSVNDTHGHSFADSVLKFVAGMIKKFVRSSDIVARYGGDEFVIFMDNVPKKIAENVARRIQTYISKSTFRDTCCTVSIGVCCLDASGKIGINEAISVADKFMYIAKENGGNSVQICA